jgi:hypothetical protein
MSDMSIEQIAQEFRRQVRLCSGLGKAFQLIIVNEHWEKSDREAEMFTKKFVNKNRGASKTPPP